MTKFVAKLVLQAFFVESDRKRGSHASRTIIQLNKYCDLIGSSTIVEKTQVLLSLIMRIT